jgi:hypothetical protein
MRWAARAAAIGVKAERTPSYIRTGTLPAIVVAGVMRQRFDL